MAGTSPAMTTEAASGRSRACLALQTHLGLKAVKIAEDRGDREGAPRTAHAHQAVLAGNITLDDKIVPPLGMTDVVDGNVVVLAPEKGNRIVGLAGAKHVESRRLSLPLRHDPMLDANGLTSVPIRPTRDVA